MAKASDFIQWKTHRTEPVSVNGKLIQLESKALSLQFPGGGYVWNRGTAVTINQSIRIPITDPTRNALWAISGISILISAIAWLKQNKEKQHG